MIVYVKRRGLTARACQIFVPLILLTLVALLFLRDLRKNEVSLQLSSTKTASGSPQVDIQSRTPIGEYLWNHLLEGKKELMTDRVSYKGKSVVDDLSFTFQSGNAGILITSDSNVVLVIDGSSQLKQKKEELYINDMLLFHPPKSLFLVILGDNACGHNQWIVPYLSSNGGPVNAAFMVRGSFMTNDDEVYRWPLGVATHSDFPLFWADEIDILSPRPFICNYVDSVAISNTTRSIIPQLFKELNLERLCHLKINSNTLTNGLIGESIQAVSDSDLSLCPATEFDGPETHCIYEALSLGSVPVVEEVKASCDRDSLFLLKKNKAPFILVESLEKELKEVIANENRMNLQEKIARRARVINWYADFRHSMARQFVRVIHSKLNL